MDSKKPSPNRRGFLLKTGAGLAGLAAGAAEPASAKTPATPKGPPGTAPRTTDPQELIAYGERSAFVTSRRVSDMDGARAPDMFGRIHHVLSPLQDSVGMVTPASLHFVSGHAGLVVPNIDPAQHRLMIHGMVDHPLVFTMDDLKRFPSVSRFHFLECDGNRSDTQRKTVQETHGLTGCSEWSGVLLSTLLKEAGVQKGAYWVVLEAADAVRSAKSLPLAKAMDDCIVAYGQNGEPIRPQQGFPLRMIVPGFEGIYNMKFLTRIKVVDQPYVTPNDFSHIERNPEKAALLVQIGPKSVITRPSGGQKLAGPGFYEITGLAWSGGGAVRKVEISTDGGKSWKDAELKSAAHRMAHTRFGFNWHWDGKECELQSRCVDETGDVQPTRAQVAAHWKKRNVSDFEIRDGEARVPGCDNTIQPWRVASDGSVHNAIAKFV